MSIFRADFWQRSFLFSPVLLQDKLQKINNECNYSQLSLDDTFCQLHYTGSIHFSCCVRTAKMIGYSKSTFTKVRLYFNWITFLASLCLRILLIIFLSSFSTVILITTVHAVVKLPFFFLTTVSLVHIWFLCTYAHEHVLNGPRFCMVLPICHVHKPLGFIQLDSN